MEGYHVLQTHPQLLPSSHPAGARRRCTPFIAGEPALHADAQRRHGGHDPQERHADRRRAAAMSLPDDPARGDGGVARAVNDAVTTWHRARGCDFPDLNDLDRRASSPDRVLLPALFPAAAVQQRVVVPDPPARPGGDAVRDVVAHPLPERPVAGQADAAASRWRPTTRAGRRSRRRTSRTCPSSRRACTPRASSTCGSRTRSRG